MDRPGGYLEGTIDEEKHYQFVKSCVAQSGAGYYDVMKFALRLPFGG